MKQWHALYVFLYSYGFVLVDVVALNVYFSSVNGTSNNEEKSPKCSTRSVFCVQVAVCPETYWNGLKLDAYYRPLFLIMMMMTVLHSKGVVLVLWLWYWLRLYSRTTMRSNCQIGAYIFLQGTTRCSNLSWIGRNWLTEISSLLRNTNGHRFGISKNCLSTKPEGNVPCYRTLWRHNKKMCPT